ncbi:hypothetical protein F5Y07DRAFT_203895 [Xylaria sp. FL0933]|nr:hypothetical protein F5Y07DRAFT_203895 [Xylaria sp. FL0933]
MLRRPPTTLSLTAEDIAAYEDRRYEQLQAQAQAHAQAQAQAQLQSRAQPRHGLLDRHGRSRLSAMDTSTSSPNDSTDEAMEDVVAPVASFDDDDEDNGNNDGAEDDEEEDEEDEDDDDEDPFQTRGDLRAAGGGGRALSPGARRSAYISQMRARGGGHARSQSHTHATSIPTSTSAYASAAASRSQRIMGSTSASAIPSAAASGQSSQVPAHLQQTPVQTAAQGSTTTRAGAGRAGRQASEPPPAPARVTRSRDERIGLAAGAQPPDNMGRAGAAGPTMRRR